MMSLRPGPLLERQRIFHSRSAEETRAFLHGKDFRFEVAPAQAAQLDVHLNGVYLPDMYIGYLQYGCPVDIRVNPGRYDYWIQLPTRGRIEVTVGQECVVCGPERAAIVSPMRDNRMRTDGLSARLSLAPSKAAVVRYLAALLGEPVDEEPEFAPDLDLTGGYGRDLARWVLLAVNDIEQAGALPWTPITVGLFEEFIISRLLLSHPHTYGEALRRTGRRSVAPRDVKRAIDYMQAHLGAPISVADIAEASGIAGRTLFKHFRDFHGISPMRYLRNARLEQVRQALMRAQPGESITGIAMGWGFGHMGRFSVEYRRRFGESPSRTLRAHRLRRSATN